MYSNDLIYHKVGCSLTALFTNMRILKFKSQLTITFFAVINHLNGPLRKQNFTLTGSKGHGFWFVIGEFRSVLCVCVSRFVTCDRNHDWRQPKTQLRGRLLNLRVRMFVKSAVKLQYNYQVSNVKITDRFLDIWTSSLNSIFIWFLTGITSSRLMNSSNQLLKLPLLIHEVFIYTNAVNFITLN